jgi:hypothetical protein
MLYNYGITYSMMFIIINKSICKYYVLCRVYFIRLEDVNSVLHKTYFLTLFCLCNEAPSFGVRILESLEHFCWVVGSCGSVWTLPAHPTNFHIYVFTWTPILSKSCVLCYPWILPSHQINCPILMYVYMRTYTEP